MNDEDFLRLAFKTAAVWSDDRSTQNGAVLVPLNGRRIAVANHFPAGVEPRLARPAKYQFIEHAERAAIYAAARAGTATAWATLYCCWFACPDCARAIVEAGIREVVGHATPWAQTPVRWASEVATGEQILREGGVAVRRLAAPLGVKILFDGEVLEC
jgi:dCMP deaminase